ncbi:MAG: retroviral-like aspartic protease family protein [Flavobacteriales bacterium]|jgi:hypothetical protein|tara:strand:+ start:8947 stop:10059 length:1113 start_codon:yes stop_codon:yes gene_type:complete
MKKITLLLMFIPFMSFGQDDVKKCDKEVQFTNAKYVGCTDVENQMDGFGKLTFDDGSIYEGYFKKNKRDGFGKLTSADGNNYEGDWVKDEKDGFGKYKSADGNTYEGNYKNNMKNGEGEYSYQIANQKITEEGVFKNDMFFSGVKLTDINNGTFLKSVFKNGDRIKLVQTSPQFTIESNGSYYSNGTLRTGIEKTISQNGFLIIEKSFENGDEIIGSEKSNIKNYYVKDDIEGDLELIKINLETEPNDDTKYINLKIATKTPTENFRFIFDTGAEPFTIGYNLFNKLKENGLEYDDMNVIIATIGVRGEPTNNKVIRLKELTIGEYKVRNVIALVETLETANVSLLGIGFMKKFKNVLWSLNDNQIIFYK